MCVRTAKRSECWLIYVHIRVYLRIFAVHSDGDSSRILVKGPRPSAFAEIYHRNRTLSLLGITGHNSGWDMLIEKENLMIRSKEMWFGPLCNALHNMWRAFVTSFVTRMMDRVLLRFRDWQNPATMKSIRDDVDAIVEYLKDKCGSTWAAACVPGRATRLVNPARSPKPWLSVQRAERDGSLRR